VNDSSDLYGRRRVLATGVPELRAEGFAGLATALGQSDRRVGQFERLPKNRCWEWRIESGKLAADQAPG
jgi:hypothetical protein